MDAALDQLPDDPAALKAIIAEERALRAQMSASVKAHEALVEVLKLRIARLRRQTFGRSSEKIEREITQLGLALEALEVKFAAEDTRPEAGESDTGEPTPARAAPCRRGKPRISEDAQREQIVLDPGEVCPECGGALRLPGEDVSEILDYVAAKLKVVETVHPKTSCRRCERIAQVPSPSLPVRRGPRATGAQIMVLSGCAGRAGPGLLAHILFAKFDDHLPLYRQGEIFARLGALRHRPRTNGGQWLSPRSTLMDWCGQAVGALDPLVAKTRQSVLSADRLHVDDRVPMSNSHSEFSWGPDTPIRVLDPKMKAAGKERVASP